MRIITSSTHTQPQSTSRIMMIRPASFAFNVETAASNAYQQGSAAKANPADTREDAAAEFNLLVDQLRISGINVRVYNDSEEVARPDAIFPNNWISFHQSGKVVLYPMMAENRRTERRPDIVEDLKKDFKIEEIVDLTHFENEGKYLEGTGSMVLDRRYKIAYACLSPRTHPEVLEAFGEALGYEVIPFSASDENNQPIYHTNVLMCIGDVFAVICLEAIKNPDERYLVRSALEETGKFIIELSLDQVRHFAGNMLLVRNKNGSQFLVMSTQAYEALNSRQKEALSDYAKLLHSDLSVIEKNGGGSARCMMTEIHLPIQ